MNYVYIPLNPTYYATNQRFSFSVNPEPLNPNPDKPENILLDKSFANMM